MGSQFIKINPDENADEEMYGHQEILLEAVSRQSDNNIGHLLIKMDFVAPPSIDLDKLPPYLDIG